MMLEGFPLQHLVKIFHDPQQRPVGVHEAMLLQQVVHFVTLRLEALECAKDSRQPAQALPKPNTAETGDPKVPETLGN